MLVQEMQKTQMQDTSNSNSMSVLRNVYSMPLDL
jgi:hypothetical protein